MRPEIPHVGEIAVMGKDGGGDGGAGGSELTRVNLRRGEPRKMVLTAAYEEGFAGDLSFTVAGLPEGVEAYPAVQYSDGRGPLEVTQNAEVIAPKRQKTALVLVAEAGAPLTREPRRIQLYCQPIVNGKLGERLLVRELPLMVVETAGEETGAGR